MGGLLTIRMARDTIDIFVFPPPLRAYNKRVRKIYCIYCSSFLIFMVGLAGFLPYKRILELLICKRIGEKTGLQA